MLIYKHHNVFHMEIERYTTLYFCGMNIFTCYLNTQETLRYFREQVTTGEQYV